MAVTFAESDGHIGNSIIVRAPDSDGAVAEQESAIFVIADNGGHIGRAGGHVAVFIPENDGTIIFKRHKLVFAVGNCDNVAESGRDNRGKT
jgi:hypothetical protein